MTTADTDVWVHDYTTSSGVHVAGHWRRRGPAGGATRGDVSEDARSAGGLPAAGETSPAGRLTAAETRYQAAVVAAAVSSLRHRRGLPTDLSSALQERSAARAELDAARHVTDAPTTPSTEAGPAEGDHPAGGGVTRCPHCGQYRDAEHQCPTPAGLPTGDYAGLKGDERVKAMVADLQASVTAIVESGQLQRWLDAMASNGLARWSANNRLLAAVQLLHRGESLEGLHLMGFRQWEQFHRRVAKGAKAVWILAPITRKVVDVEEDGSTSERYRVAGFKGVPVFSISDTHGEPLPGPPVRPAEGEATPGTLAGLRDRVAQAGYSFAETEIPGCQPTTGQGTLGYTDPLTKRIVVDARLSDAQKASTIAHELGHVQCGHVDADPGEYQRHRGRMETEAEMTAYLINRSRGMSRGQVDAFSPGYIATWSRGDPTVVHAALERATHAYNTIIDGPWPTVNGA